MREFSRNKDHRELMLRNLATSLILFEKVDSTEAKVKELKPFADKIIARAKKADLAAIRNLHKILLDDNAVKKVIEVLIPRYQSRQSGFTKTYHLKNRLGDNSRMMRIELIDKMAIAEKKALKPESKTTKKTDKEVKDVK